MPVLTRRKDTERSDCWDVYFGDVGVGAIGRRAGVPLHVDQWEWGCGFYPGTSSGEGTSGTGATFEAARAGFEAACHTFLPTRTEADFQAWRDQRDWTTWKYAMSDAGLMMPTQLPNGISRCFCGASIDVRTLHLHVRDAHRPVAA
jgi:hypothetical protein